MTTFHKLGVTLENLSNLFSSSTIVQNYMTQIKPVAIIVLTIFILWRIIQIMSGSNKKPVNDVLIEVLIWAIVWNLAFDIGGWVHKIQAMMNEIYKWAGGGVGFFDNLDIWSAKFQELAGDLYAKDKSTFVKAEGILAVILVILSMILLIVVPLVIIAVSSVAVQILIVLAPFMILSIIFPSIKQLFDNWIELFLTNVLIVILISIFQDSLVTKILSFLNLALSKSEDAAVGQIVMTGVNLLMLTTFYTAIILTSVPLAKALTGSFKTMGLGKGI